VGKKLNSVLKNFWICSLGRFFILLYLKENSSRFNFTFANFKIRLKIQIEYYLFLDQLYFDEAFVRNEKKMIEILWPIIVKTLLNFRVKANNLLPLVLCRNLIQCTMKFHFQWKNKITIFFQTWNTKLFSEVIFVKRFFVCFESLLLFIKIEQT
jgi:hypothetical protein